MLGGILPLSCRERGSTGASPNYELEKEDCEEVRHADVYRLTFDKALNPTVAERYKDRLQTSFSQAWT